MKRTLVIGDIHGGLNALLQVFERARVTPTDKLIFLGDYVDGWSESAAVIDYIIQLAARNECMFIKGNHDLWCEEWLHTGKADHTWLRHGGLATVDSYRNYSNVEKMLHLASFQKMPYYHIDEKNRLFIHAGFTSEYGPSREFETAKLNWDRSLWELANKMHKRIKTHPSLYPKKLKLFTEIYIGHTPTLYHKIEVPMQGCNVWNIDTGAAFTGKLSVLDIETKQYWQSDNLPALYPNEIGRNG